MKRTPKRVRLELDRTELTALMLAVCHAQAGNGWHASTRASLERARARVAAALEAACCERG